MNTTEYIEHWRNLIDQCVDMSMGELANQTHETQVGIWGFCTCEDGPKVYDDCPDKEPVIHIMRTYNAHFTGALVAECPACHRVCAGWDDDDLNDDGQLECYCEAERD